MFYHKKIEESHRCLRKMFIILGVCTFVMLVVAAYFEDARVLITTAWIGCVVGGATIVLITRWFYEEWVWIHNKRFLITIFIVLFLSAEACTLILFRLGIEHKSEQRAQLQTAEETAAEAAAADTVEEQPTQEYHPLLAFLRIVFGPLLLLSTTIFLLGRIAKNPKHQLE